MPNTRSPTGWYYCSYLLRLTLAGSPSAQDPEARFLSYENTVLIRADSSLEAYDKTLRIARENETSYTNEHQQDVQWKLVGITDILPIYEALGDGAEIAFTSRPPRVPLFFQTAPIHAGRLKKLIQYTPRKKPARWAFSLFGRA